MESERNCNGCIWARRDGDCASWDCIYVPMREAYNAWKAWKEKQEAQHE